MKILQLITQNIKRKKFRTFLYVFGVIISTSLILTMGFLGDRYQGLVSGFFQPFSDYDQVITKGSNYFQILPGNSFINESENYDNIYDQFEIEPIPCLFIANSSSYATNDNTYIMGIPYEKMDLLWNKMGLYSGKWPEGPNDIIVGYDQRNYTSFTIYGEEYQVSGVLKPDQNYSPISTIIVLDLEELQDHTGYINKVNLFFVDQSIESNPNSINNFEANHPSLDVYTSDDLNIIQSQVFGSVNDISKVLLIITQITSIIYITAIGTLQINKKQSDVSILKAIGMPNSSVFKILFLEFILIFLIGVIFGILCSLPMYLIIITNYQKTIQPNLGFGSQFIYNGGIFFKTLSISDVVVPSTFILLMGTAICLIPALLSLKIKPLKDLKEKK